MADDLPGQWWTLFGSKQLDALVEAAMASYPDIEAQQAALREARDNVRAQQGLFVPQVQAAFNQERAKISGASIAPGFPGYVTNLYQANVNVSYTFDFFGAERRQLENLQAQATYQNYVLEGSYLTLTTNVASTAVQLVSAKEQIVVTHEIIALEEKELGIIQRQFDLGTHTRADVLQQQSNLASVRATLPGLQQQLAAAEHQLAVLTGRFPHDAIPVAIRSVGSEIAGRSARQPAFQARRAAARYPRTGSAGARGQRRDWRRHGQYAAAGDFDRFVRRRIAAVRRPLQARLGRVGSRQRE